MLFKLNQSVYILFAVSCLAINLALAKPYYYFFQANPEEQQPAAAAAAAPAGANPGTQVQQAAEGMQQAAQDAMNSVQQQTANIKPELLQEKISGHLGQLYNHGSTAVKNAVDNVAPDFKNIGADLTEVYHVTGDNVGKKIEPLANNVKPYINKAQSAMAPYVSQAKEEVPKLINQAGPALTKVGEQVRDGLTGVWEKIKTVGNQDQFAGAAAAVTGPVQQVAGQMKDLPAKAAEQLPATGSVTDAAKDAASQTQQVVQQTANQIQS